jgi:urease accessory protein
LTGRLAWGSAAGALLVIVAGTGPASAHMLDNRFGDFYGGVIHPLTALEHALPILAVGLLAGQQGERAARWLVLAFPLALLIGAGLPTLAPSLPSMGVLNAASFVVLGLLVAAGWRLPLTLLIALGECSGSVTGTRMGAP